MVVPVFARTRPRAGPVSMRSSSVPSMPATASEETNADLTRVSNQADTSSSATPRAVSLS